MVVSDDIQPMLNNVPSKGSSMACWIMTACLLLWLVGLVGLTTTLYLTRGHPCSSSKQNGLLLDETGCYTLYVISALLLISTSLCFLCFMNDNTNGRRRERSNPFFLLGREDSDVPTFGWLFTTQVCCDCLGNALVTASFS